MVGNPNSQLSCVVAAVCGTEIVDEAVCKIMSIVHRFVVDILRDRINMFVLC